MQLFHIFIAQPSSSNLLEEDEAVDKRGITSMPKIALILSVAYGKTLGLESSLNTVFIRILSKNNQIF